MSLCTSGLLQHLGKVLRGEGMVLSYKELGVVGKENLSFRWDVRVTVNFIRKVFDTVCVCVCMCVYGCEYETNCFTTLRHYYHKSFVTSSI